MFDQCEGYDLLDWNPGGIFPLMQQVNQVLGQSDCYSMVHTGSRMNRNPRRLNFGNSVQPCPIGGGI